MSNCTGQRNCGCQDRGLTTQYPCGNNSNCPNPEPCPETFEAQCVVYTGDTIYDESTGIIISNGDRVSNIIQALFSMITGVGCLDESSACFSVLNLRSTSITSTTISLAWNLPSTAPTNLQVYYKEFSAVPWSQSAVLTAGTTTLTLTGLTANSVYMIKVNSLCGGDTCYSLTILVTTLES